MVQHITNVPNKQITSLVSYAQADWTLILHLAVSVNALSHLHRKMLPHGWNC
jgi:hypothetical protein